MELNKDIIKNDPLTESLFTIFVSFVTKIPLIVIGKTFMLP